MQKFFLIFTLVCGIRQCCCQSTTFNDDCVIEAEIQYIAPTCFNYVKIDYELNCEHLTRTCFTNKKTDFNLDCIGSSYVDKLKFFDCDNSSTTSTKEFLKRLKLKYANDVGFYEPNIADAVKREKNVNYKKGAEMLEISFNNGTVLPSFFENYQDLKVLNIHSRGLETVPKKLFNNLQQLKTLVWTNNEWFVFEQSEIEDLPKLENITIDYLKDKFQVVFHPEFPLNFNNMTTLRELRLLNIFGKNISEKLFKGAQNLKLLKLSENWFGELPTTLFEDLINLKTLILSYNALKTVDGKLFEKLTQLEFLDLTNNWLSDIVWSWPLLPQLKMLNLNDNKIDYLKIQLNSTNFKIIECNNCALQMYHKETEALICRSEYGKRNICEFVNDRNGIACPERCDCEMDKTNFKFTINCAARSSMEVPELPQPNIGNVTLRLQNNNFKMWGDSWEFICVQPCQIE